MLPIRAALLGDLWLWLQLERKKPAGREASLAPQVPGSCHLQFATHLSSVLRTSPEGAPPCFLIRSFSGELG